MPGGCCPAGGAILGALNLKNDRGDTKFLRTPHENAAIFPLRQQEDGIGFERRGNRLGAKCKGHLSSLDLY